MTEKLPDIDKEDSVPFFPNHFMTEFRMALVIIGIFIAIGAVGMFMPVGLQEPADPLNTPLHVKPEWYFLFLYQLLKVVPDYVFFGQIEGRMLVTVATIAGLMVLMFLPLFDKKDDTKRAWWIRAGLSALALIIIVALTVWGEVS